MAELPQLLGSKRPGGKVMRPLNRASGTRPEVFEAYELAAGRQLLG